MEEEEEETMNDLCSMGITNGKELISELRERFNKDEINTFVGDVLLVINPFKKLPSNEETHRSLGPNQDRPAHLSSVSWRAYQAMSRTRVNQCCITTGVSGSGKTESTKYLMQHLVELSTASNGFVKERILQVHSVIEAFGNASTSLNYNSSRFCKYFEIFYNEEQRLVGGELAHYMLQKTRITFQEMGEKNFHVFYYLLYGAKDDLLYELALNPSVGYRFMCSERRPTIDVDEASKSKVELELLVQNLMTFNLNAQDVKDIFCCLAAILHLGEIEFIVERNGSTSVDNEDALQNASFLLGLLPQQLEMLLVRNLSDSGESTIQKTSYKTIAEANAVRNSMAETLYLRLVNFIVWSINTYLLPEENQQRASSRLATIGFLDIFGFQHLYSNRLEQFIVNMANEQLSYFYNQYVFAWEQNEYQTEGVRSAIVRFVDNTKTIELLLNQKQGLLALLDEETRSTKGDNVTLMKKFTSSHKNSSVYNVARKSQESVFTVRHHAGEVTYDASNFVEKNRVATSRSVIRCLAGSQKPLIQRLFQARVSRTGSFGTPYPSHKEVERRTLSRKSKKKRLSGTMRRKVAVVSHLTYDSKTSHNTQVTTVGSIFRNSLAEIMGKILKSNCHFIRCIKPNQNQAPGYFNDKLVLAQLQQCHVLETLYIRRSGYSVRLSFATFIERYKLLCFPLMANIKENDSSCEAILTTTKQPSDGWTIGKTKVLLRYWCADTLDKMLDKVLHDIVLLQKVFRRWKARKRFAKMMYQQRVEKPFVESFLTQISDQWELGYQRLSLQNDEDKLREHNYTLSKSSTSSYSKGQKSKKVQSTKPETPVKPNSRLRLAAAVNALEKQNRPGKHVDTMKYERKNWARKQVTKNFFSKGK